MIYTMYKSFILYSELQRIPKPQDINRYQLICDSFVNSLNIDFMAFMIVDNKNNYKGNEVIFCSITLYCSLFLINYTLNSRVLYFLCSNFLFYFFTLYKGKFSELSHFHLTSKLLHLTTRVQFMNNYSFFFI